MAYGDRLAMCVGVKAVYLYVVSSLGHEVTDPIAASLDISIVHDITQRMCCSLHKGADNGRVCIVSESPLYSII